MDLKGEAILINEMEKAKKGGGGNGGGDGEEEPKKRPVGTPIQVKCGDVCDDPNNCGMHYVDSQMGNDYYVTITGIPGKSFVMHANFTMVDPSNEGCAPEVVSNFAGNGPGTHHVHENYVKEGGSYDLSIGDEEHNTGSYDWFFSAPCQADFTIKSTWWLEC